MIKVVSVCGSPVPESSTAFLLQRIAGAVRAGLPGDSVRHRLVHLNNIDMVPCQACGEAPTPKFCFLHDELSTLYSDVASADCLLFGSPIYFDAVSAQAKIFIDRCNCFRPADFGRTEPDHDFVKLLSRKRPGAIVLVGSEGGYIEGARRCIAGYFKWVEVVNEGLLTYETKDFTRECEVVDSAETLAEADRLGAHLAQKIRESHAGR